VGLEVAGVSELLLALEEGAEHRHLHEIVLASDHVIGRERLLCILHGDLTIAIAVVGAAALGHTPIEVLVRGPGVLANIVIRLEGITLPEVLSAKLLEVDEELPISAKLGGLVGQARTTLAERPSKYPHEVVMSMFQLRNICDEGLVVPHSMAAL
jgi:hypothetical protein